jgi:hypothetical protein
MSTTHDHVGTQVPEPSPLPPAPSAWLTGVISFFFGPAGAFAASSQAKKAAALGYPTRPYWKTFWLTWLISWLVGVLILPLLLFGGLGIFAATHGGLSGSTPIAEQPVANQPVGGGSATPGGNQLPSPAPTGTVTFRHRPALSNYQGTAQWFEDALLKGLGQRDPRYFDLVFALHNASYNDTLATMSQYSSTYHAPKVAHISDFKLLDEAPGAHFVASYVVKYYDGNDGTPQHEKITAVLQNGLWYLDYYEFSS